MIDWIELVKTIGTTLLAVIAAVSSLIAVIKGKEKNKKEKENEDLKKKNEDKETEIKRLHNGFRESVDNRLAVLEKRLEPRVCTKCKPK